MRNFLSRFGFAVLLGVAALFAGGASHAAPSEQAPAKGITVERFLTIVSDPKSGREHSLVTLILSNGRPVTATAEAVKDVAGKDLAEARVQDARRNASRRGGTESPSFACAPSESPTVVDVQFMLQSGPVTVYQPTYSNGAQQVMAINQQTGEVTLGPVVGGC